MNDGIGIVLLAVLIIILIAILSSIIIIIYNNFVRLKNNIDKLKRDMVNFLDIEKLERGQLFYNHDQIINLTKVLNTEIILFREIAENKKIKIIKEISDENIYINVDAYAIDRVINNILENAINTKAPTILRTIII